MLKFDLGDDPLSNSLNQMFITIPIDNYNPDADLNLYKDLSSSQYFTHTHTREIKI